MRYLLALGVLFASPAYAAPTYLVCSIANEKGPILLDVTADEANGTVTTLLESTGYSEKRTAIFSASDVKWSSPLAYGSITYALSRTTLALVRTLAFGDKALPDTGTCKIQEAPKRAF